MAATIPRSALSDPMVGSAGEGSREVAATIPCPEGSGWGGGASDDELESAEFPCIPPT